MSAIKKFIPKALLALVLLGLIYTCYVLESSVGGDYFTKGKILMEKVELLQSSAISASERSSLSADLEAVGKYMKDDLTTMDRIMSIKWFLEGVTVLYALALFLLIRQGKIKLKED